MNVLHISADLLSENSRPALSLPSATHPHQGKPPLERDGPPLSSFEFWPMWASYPPVMAYAAWLMLRYSGVLLPTVANPSFPGGGFYGESKADILALAIKHGGIYTRAIAENSSLMDRLTLDPLRQLIGAQCSGTLLIARLGLIGNMPACTDTTTKPWVVQAGVRVVDEPFRARGPVSTEGGCMVSQYVATWVMLRRAGLQATEQALHYVAPVSEKDEYVQKLLGGVRPFVAE